jgi:hypothetical protein
MSALEPASLRITYQHVQRFTDPLRPGAQDFQYQVAGTVGDERVEVGAGCAVLVDLFGPDPYGSLSGCDRHVRRIGDVAFDRATGELDPSWGHDLEMIGDRLLILGELTVERQWRGGWVVGVISAMVVARLRHCVVAAMYAAGGSVHAAGGATDGVDQADQTDPADQADQADELAAMRAAGLALRPARDGVHYLDPATAHLDLAASAGQGDRAGRRPVLL